MRKPFLLYPFALFTGLMLLLSSCESGNSGTTGEQTTSPTDTSDSKEGKVKNILYSIPSPMEMADIIKESGSQYDVKILNPTENSRKYSGEGKLALNLGIYGADLSYNSMFDQRQESMNYLAAAQKIARDLGVDGALQDDLIDRLNNNQENRDSLLNIVSQAYADLNDYLKENNREHVSAMVIAGGWVEGLYLACYYSGKSKDEALKQRIAEQKYSLKDLISLMESYGDQPILKDVLADLNQVQALFNEMTASTEKTQTTKASDGTVVIGGGGAVTMSNELLAKVASKITEIRTRYIS